MRERTEHLLSHLVPRLQGAKEEGFVVERIDQVRQSIWRVAELYLGGGLSQLYSRDTVVPVLIRDAFRLFEFIMKTRRLFAAIHRAPHKKIYGAQGVAEQLGVTPSAVYSEMTYLGITADDLHTFPLDDILKESTKVQALLKSVETRLESIGGLQKRDSS